jgi:hypothetical protein
MANCIRIEGVTGLPVASSRSTRAWLAEARNSRKPGWVLSGIGGPGSCCRQAKGSQGDGKPPAGQAGRHISLEILMRLPTARAGEAVAAAQLA